MIDVVIDGKWAYNIDEDFLNSSDIDIDFLRVWMDRYRLINEISTAI